LIASLVIVTVIGFPGAVFGTVAESPVPVSQETKSEKM
jgi:hypothetical protein